MRLFFVGDFCSDNGPASVNKALRKSMPIDTLYSEEKKQYKRILELFLKIWKADSVLFSGFSKINIVGLTIAKILRRKTAYLMHGSVFIEGKINQDFNPKFVNIENQILKSSPKIICVSESFMNNLKEYYPQFSSKFTYVNNGVEFNMEGLTVYSNIKRDKNMLLSVGGGMPRKNIIKICEAIAFLNKKEEYNLKLTVIGAVGRDTNKIKSYPFVTYIEYVPKDEMPLYYKMANLYIQNSEFETFGLAPIEALICGSNLLISKNVGAKSIIKEIDQNDLIYDINNIKEISNKIVYKLQNPNNRKLLESLNKRDVSVEESCKRILHILT